jgi:ATP-dependent phosphofructokinase / diphosphate-dependent phosphofructokinase
MAKTKLKSIAVMTGGGDCPGLNAVIRAVTKTAISNYGMDVWGIQDGYLGLIENRIDRLSYENVSNILTVGGTILGSSNTSNPFAFPVKVGKKTQMKDVSDDCLANLKERGIDALVCIGGDGTMASAAAFAKKGLPVMGVPKTIDNDLVGTDVTFGFDTAVTTATEAIDKIHTTASSHHRVMIVEVMGRYAGWISLYAGAAGGADVILLPEIPYKLEKVCKYVLGRSRRGKRFSLVVVSEGAREKDGQMVVQKRIANSPDPIRLGGIANKLAEDINAQTSLDCRAVVLGHVQRGGTPTPCDRTLATMLGHSAIELLAGGVKNRLVVWKDGGLSSVPLARVAGKVKKVPRNHPLIKAAKAIGASFGT